MRLTQLALLMLFFFPLLSCAFEDFLSQHTSTHQQIKQLLALKRTDSHTISICYNYGCKSQKNIYISAQNIQSLKNIFKKFNKNGKVERHAITQAIALLETIAAAQSPIHNDKARNHDDNGLPGRMDCIDSTVNTTHYLEFINNLGLIHWHKLQEPIYRSPFIMGQHWSAQIQDVTSKQHYAVDSWETDVGMSPIISDIESWKNRE